MNCVHHWLIPTPDGRALLPSECKRCGAVREFSAAGQESDVGFNGNASVFLGEKVLAVR